MTNGLTNSVAQRLFIVGSTRQRPPHSSADGDLIMIMPGPSMEGISSCDVDVSGRARDPRVHNEENCAGDTGDVVVSDGGENPFSHPPDALIYSPGGIGVKVNMKRVEEGYLEFPPQNYAAGLQAGGRRDIDDNKNERVEVKEAPRVM